jgi:ketosteroid isomerase-like protein
MTTFAPHRDTLEAFVDCINGGADKDTLTRLLAENVVLYGPFGDEPVVGRETAVETIKTVNGLSSDDTYMEVLSGDTHHAAHFRLQVGDAAVNGIFFVLLDADGKIAEVEHFLPHPAGWRRTAAQPCGRHRHAALGTAHQRGVTTKAVPSFTTAQPGFSALSLGLHASLLC